MEFAKFAWRFLREASTGIADVDVETSEIPTSKLPSGLAEALLRGALEGQTVPLGDASCREIFFEGPKKDTIKTRWIVASHELATGAKARASSWKRSLMGHGVCLTFCLRFTTWKKAGYIWLTNSSAACIRC